MCVLNHTHVMNGGNSYMDVYVCLYIYIYIPKHKLIA